MSCGKEIKEACRAFNLFCNEFNKFNTVNPLYNDTLYNSKMLYNVIRICTKVPVWLKIEIITTEIQFIIGVQTLSL